uniref:hypothetical protein n=1 Tax=Cupriavidus yeoncheonensis TaxID=1462994 RepID=UPI003F4916AC
MATLIVNDGQVNSAPVTVQITAASAVSFDSATPMPPQVPSYGPEAYAFTTIGDSIKLQAGAPRTLETLSVVMSSWACERGAWSDGKCSTTPGSTFNVPITLAVFDSGKKQVAAVTQTFPIPYRPSADPDCTGPDAGKWKAANGSCYNGFANKITFNLSALKATLPDGTLSFQISYNTNTHGPNPIGQPGPYDSLNVGTISAPTVPSVGSNSTPGSLLWDGVLSNVSANVMAQVTTVKP